MDAAATRLGSAGGDVCTTPTPLMPVSHNQQRDAALGPSSLRPESAAGPLRDSTVHDKINQFNSLAMQSKQLERKTADAALKRAMLGREQAENEMRQYRDETRVLRRHLDEGKQREQKVGERLETVMENYARAKETHAHTQSLWEKEIRRARKETFKSQSAMVKLQEELKTARVAQKSVEEMLELEKERSKAREQEAFAARYSLVGVQEQLEQALERIRILEQERDAFKSLAKSEEEVARIAADGMLPLPPSGANAEDDEFSSPKKNRVSSISVVDVRSSEASEAEIEELTLLWQWERQRANRALAHVEFLETEREIGCFPRPGEVKPSPRASAGVAASPRRTRMSPVKIADASDLAILRKAAPVDQPTATVTSPPPNRSKTEMLKRSRESQQSPAYVFGGDVFRTVSQEEAEAKEAAEKIIEVPEPSTADESAMSESHLSEDLVENHPMYSRTPSVEPPNFALPAGCRTSLLSLLDAPHQQESDVPMMDIPNISASEVASFEEAQEAAEPNEPQPTADAQHSDTEDDDTITPPDSAVVMLDDDSESTCEAESDRPHSSAAFYSVKTTTIKVNMESPQKPNLSARLLALQRTPSNGSSSEKPSFDVTNPALTPTMTREQALAQIRERRGRTRSVAQGAVTPRKQMVTGMGSTRRDVSAPAGRVGAPVSVGRRVRS